MGCEQVRINDCKKYRPDDKLYVALLELDFTWYPSEVEKVKQDYNDDIPLSDIANELKRDPDEVAILIMDLSRQGLIKRRKSGAYGKQEEK